MVVRGQLGVYLFRDSGVKLRSGDSWVCATSLQCCRV